MFGVVIVVVAVVLLVFPFGVLLVVDDGFVAAIDPAPRLPAQRLRYVVGERFVHRVHAARHGAAAADHFDFHAVDPVGQRAGVDFVVTHVKALNANKLAVTTNAGFPGGREIDHDWRQGEGIVPLTRVGLVPHGDTVHFPAGDTADAGQRLHRPAVQHPGGVAHALIVAFPHHRVHLGVTAVFVDVARAIDQQVIDPHRDPAFGVEIAGGPAIAVAALGVIRTEVIRERSAQVVRFRGVDIHLTRTNIHPVIALREVQQQTHLFLIQLERRPGAHRNTHVVVKLLAINALQ